MITRRYSAAEPVGQLVEEFHKLPGIGPKTAQRLTYHLVRMPRDDALRLAGAILAVKDRIVLCSRCYNITEADPCPSAAVPTGTAPAYASSRRPSTWWRWSGRAPTQGCTTCSTASSPP